MNPSDIEAAFLAKANEYPEEEMGVEALSLVLFGDNVAIPRACAHSAIFAGKRRKKGQEREILNGEVASLNGIRINLAGPSLTQTHFQVFLTVVRLAAGLGKTYVSIGNRELCRECGMSPGGETAKRLTSIMNDLHNAKLEATWKHNKKLVSFSGVLISSVWMEGGSLKAVRLNSDVHRLLEGAAFISSSWLFSLRPLERHLAAYILHQRKRIEHKLSSNKWIPIFGFINASKKEANRELRKALAELENQKIITEWSLGRNGMLHVRRR